VAGVRVPRPLVQMDALGLSEPGCRRLPRLSAGGGSEQEGGDHGKKQRTHRELVTEGACGPLQRVRPNLRSSWNCRPWPEVERVGLLAVEGAARDALGHEALEV